MGATKTTTTTSLPPPTLVAAAASSDSDPAISFGFGGQGAVATSVGYTNLAFAVFSWGYLIIILGLSSFSSSTFDDTNKDTAALVAAQYFLVKFGGYAEEDGTGG